MRLAKNIIRDTRTFNFHDTGIAFAGSVGVLSKNLQRDYKAGTDVRSYNEPTVSSLGVSGVSLLFPTGQGNGATLVPASLSVNESYKLKSYFDSVMGVTAGNRYCAAAQYSANHNTNVFKVLPDGSLELASTLMSGASNTLTSYIFAETNNEFFIVSSNAAADNHLTSTHHQNIIRYDKTTKNTSLVSAANTYDGWRLVFMGIFNNAAVFMASNVSAASGNTYSSMLVTLDLATGALKNTTSTLFNPTFHLPSMHSQALMAADNKTAYTFKVNYQGAFVTGQLLSIMRVKVNTLLALTDTFLPANMQQCVLVGAPAEFAPAMRVAGEGGSMAYTYKTSAFKGANGKTYVTVSILLGNPGNSYVASIGNTGTFVFRLEADETTLTYCSKIMHGFGANMVLATPSQRNLILAQTNSRMVKLQWDEVSESYAMSDFIAIIAGTAYGVIAVDEEENVFISTSSADSRGNHVLIISNFKQSASASATFATAGQLVYTGSPIPVNLIVNATNAMGDRVSRKVRIALDGCTFATGGGTLQEFTTSGTGDLTVGVVINGSGSVSATPVLV